MAVSVTHLNPSPGPLISKRSTPVFTPLNFLLTDCSQSSPHCSHFSLPTRSPDHSVKVAAAASRLSNEREPALNQPPKTK